MANAGWHGKVTGSWAESRIPSQVLKDVPENMLRCIRFDMLLIEEHSVYDVPPGGVGGQHFMTWNIHGIVEVAFRSEVALVAYAQ